MRIGKLSRHLNIPASTIRYYEKIGLIEAPRRVSGNREFDESAIFALEFIRLAQGVGFTIAEIKELLQSYSQDQSPVRAWRELAEKKQVDVQLKMRALKQVDSILSELLSCQCSSLTECIKIGLSRDIGGQNASR